MLLRSTTGDEYVVIGRGAEKTAFGVKAHPKYIVFSKGSGIEVESHLKILESWKQEADRSNLEFRIPKVYGIKNSDAYISENAMCEKTDGNHAKALYGSSPVHTEAVFEAFGEAYGFVYMKAKHNMLDVEFCVGKNGKVWIFDFGNTADLAMRGTDSEEALRDDLKRLGGPFTSNPSDAKIDAFFRGLSKTSGITLTKEDADMNRL